MKKDTQKAFRGPAAQDERPRKLLRLDVETLRVLHGGSQLPELPQSVLCRPSQTPTYCY